MNFALLWIDALVVSLLWVATVAACVGRLRRKWVRGMLIPVVVGPPLLLLGTFAFAATEMKFVSKLGPDWFAFALSLLLTYIIGASLVLHKSRRRKPGLAPAAAAWGRVSLAVSFMIAAVVGYMTLLNMDFAIRARGAVQSIEVNSIYLATLPAITAESQNAAPLYQRALARLKQDQDLEAQVRNPPTGNGQDFYPYEPATIAFLNHETDTIALIRQAAALPACRFDEDLSDTDMSAMLQHLNGSRNLANVLNLDAREAIAKGDASSAISDAAAIFGMSRHFGERPTLVSALVGLGIDHLGVTTLEQALPTVKSRDELVGLHLNELPSIGRVFQQALRGEERLGLLWLGNMPPSPSPHAEDQGSNLLSSQAGPAGAFFRVFYVDSDAYVQLMQSLQNASVTPYFQARQQWDQTKAQLAGRGVFTSILIPSFSRALQSLGSAEAQDVCAQTAVVATRFRLDHGALPSDLKDLVPAYLDAVPTDPFDGNAIRLGIKGNAWILYSVGPDGVDNGGAQMVQDKGDITLALKSR